MGPTTGTGNEKRRIKTLRKSSGSLRTRAFCSVVMYEHLKCR